MCYVGGRKADRKTSIRKPGKPRHMRETVRILFIKEEKKNRMGNMCPKCICIQNIARSLF